MVIEEYKTGDEQQIASLFSTAFGKELPVSYWKWRFLDNPVDNKMVKLIWDNDLLVSHYAVSGTRFLVDDQEVNAVLSGTTMTHPDYSGRGMLSTLAETLYSEIAEFKDVKAVYGYPNDNSHYALIKNLKWTDLEQVPMFSVSPGSIKSVQSDEVLPFTHFSEKHVNAYYEVTKPFKVKTFRSVPFFDWRFTQNPINVYQSFELPVGEKNYYAVTKIIPSFTASNAFQIDLVELICPQDSEILLKFLNAILSFYKDKNIEKINMWFPLNDRRHILLERIGFKNTLPIIYAGFRSFDPDFCALQNPRDWYFSMSDSDIF